MEGFQGKLLRIDLSAQLIQGESISFSLLQRTFGGANLALHYLLRELPVGADPLGQDNILIFTTGPLTGCPAPGSDMHAVLAKSPLTGGIGESQATGSWGARLKKAGFDLLLIKGKAVSPCYLVIDDDQVFLRDASHLWGMETAQAQRTLLADLDGDFSIAQIGPAGERGVHFASIVCDLCFINNRMGLGAVMGSKNLKAIAVRGDKKVSVAYPGKLSHIMENFENHFLENPVNRLTTTEGIAAAVIPCNKDGLFSVRNARTSFLQGDENLAPQAFLQGGRQEDISCFHCPARCKKSIRGSINKTVYGSPSMESIVDFSFALDIPSPHVVSHLHRMSRAHGFDTTSWGVTLGFLAECGERGLLTPSDLDGVRIAFHDEHGISELTALMLSGKGIGADLSRGVRHLSELFGNDAAPFALHVKGKEVPLHEPRVKQMVGLGYAVAPHGPDTFCVEHDTDFDESAPQLYLDSIKALGLWERIPSPTLGSRKVRMYHHLSRVFSFMDALCLCIFALAPVRYLPFSFIPQMVEAAVGWEVSLFSLMQAGEARITNERLFNVREGIARDEDWLPDRFFEPIASGPQQGRHINPTELQSAIDLYYRMVGWDTDDGLPRREKLVELDLEEYEL